VVKSRLGVGQVGGETRPAAGMRVGCRVPAMSEVVRGRELVSNEAGRAGVGRR